MLLSGKLNPATVNVPLLGVEVAEDDGVPPQAAATIAAKASAAIISRGLRFIDYLLPRPDRPTRSNAGRTQFLPFSDCHATLKTAARLVVGAFSSLRPRGTSARCSTASTSSVARARPATRIAPATISW